MKEECKDRIEVLLLDEADRLGKLAIGSEEYSKTAKLITDLTRELNSMDKNEIEFQKLQNEDEARFAERTSKTIEISNEEKKSKREFLGKVITAFLSVSIPIGIAFLEPRGFFVRREKITKF